VAEDQQEKPDPVEAPRKHRDPTDLGPTRGRVELTVSLTDSTRPSALIDWAEEHRLSVKWRDGATWAYVGGAGVDIASAFGVEIHDYRDPDDNVFYASNDDPPVPAPLRDEVSEVGRIIDAQPVRRPESPQK
jgi:kumamolisin